MNIFILILWRMDKDAFFPSIYDLFTKFKADISLFKYILSS